MPARTPTRIAVLVAMLALVAPARADAPGPGYGAPPRFAPQPHRPRALHRDAYEFGRAPRPLHGPTVRAYLPRNPNLPIYNEPPAR